ncbi:MAG: hypothetical protein B7Y80_01390 [Hyphomicrobium sp. 32-62-53]|nr:MAG: hypothetical protein B7Z29_01735 [Hyphomicrobium sp. 12-62-95]OYY01408.1 MAG: hypothetical protein B7Y80_01390 [Hyphomicrobium sp. 32-62-53]
MISAILVVPVDLRERANFLALCLGWGPDSYSVPLTIDGETISHFACRADVTESFLAMISDASNGIFPSIPMTPQEISAVVVGLLSDFAAPGQYESARSHFEAAIARHGLAPL